MVKKYNIAVFILRGQPVHNAHIEIFKQAAELAENVVIIIGSANQPRTFKNPFSTQERSNLVRESFMNELPSELAKNTRLHIRTNIDTMYNDSAWVTRIQEIVKDVSDTMNAPTIAMIGHEKDSTSFYLKMFPQWDRVEIGNIHNQLNASDIRSLYFKPDYNPNYLTGVVPECVLTFLDMFRTTPEYLQIIKERQVIEEYKKPYAALPYGIIFTTVDAVVVQSGHVLLVTRKAEPGKNLLALPGGFLNGNERLTDGVIRELREETKIKVPAPVLKGSIKSSQVFDHPDRSARGRTITYAFYIELPDGPLPKVTGSDDAKYAQWVPLSEVKTDLMFEDHADIISFFVS